MSQANGVEGEAKKQKKEKKEKKEKKNETAVDGTTPTIEGETKKGGDGTEPTIKGETNKAERVKGPPNPNFKPKKARPNWCPPKPYPIQRPASTLILPSHVSHTPNTQEHQGPRTI